MSTPKTSRKRFLIKAAVSLVITTALVLFLFRFIKLEQMEQMLADTEWSLVAVGLGMWILLYLARSLRFKLLAPRTPYLTMLSIASVHNFLLRIMPMRTGDLSYGFLIRRAGTAGLGESLLSLLLLRLLDATTVVVYFALSLGLHQGVYMLDRSVGIAVAVSAMVVFTVVVLNLARLLLWGAAVLRRLCGLLGLAERPWVTRSLQRIEGSVDSFAHVGRGVILQVSVVSLVVWLLTYGAFFAIMRAFLMPVDPMQTVLGATAGVVTGFLPVGGFGSFGTLEAGWALGFYLVGLPRARAAMSGFGVSIATFAYTALLGLAGWIGMTIISRRNS